MPTIPVARQIFPDVPNIRSYHVREILTDQPLMAERGCGETPNGLANTVLTFPGVMACVIKPYTLEVMKNPLHKWDEIERALLPLLAAFNCGLDERMLEEVKGEGE